MTRLTTRILLVLADEPLHGYGILKALEAQADLEPAPKTGSLYLALQRMGEEGLIEEAEPAASGVDRRRRYWSMTSHGQRALAVEVERLRRLTVLAEERRVPRFRLLPAEGE